MGLIYYLSSCIYGLISFSQPGVVNYIPQICMNSKLSVFSLSQILEHYKHGKVCESLIYQGSILCVFLYNAIYMYTYIYAPLVAEIFLIKKERIKQIVCGSRR